jgi:hypothetical protein
MDRIRLNNRRNTDLYRNVDDSAALHFISEPGKTEFGVMSMIKPDYFNMGIDTNRSYPGNGKYLEHRYVACNLYIDPVEDRR